MSCLQEQRRQIQAKLVSHETLGGTLENVTTEIRKNMLVQLEQDYNDRYTTYGLKESLLTKAVVIVIVNLLLSLPLQ